MQLFLCSGKYPNTLERSSGSYSGVALTLALDLCEAAQILEFGNTLITILFFKFDHERFVFRQPLMENKMPVIAMGVSAQE